MAPFDKRATYSAIDLSLYSDKKETDYGQLLEPVMDLVETMAVCPVQPLQCLSNADLATGFRTMRAGKHMRKSSSPVAVELAARRDAIPLAIPASILILLI